MHWPFRQPGMARGARRSPLHDRLEAAGPALARPRLGWPELVRARWRGAAIYQYAYGRQTGFRFRRKNIARFARRSACSTNRRSPNLLVEGRDAEKVLNWISANDVAVPARQDRLHPMAQQRAGIEADATVTREADDRYLVVTAATYRHAIGLAQARRFLTMRESALMM